MSWALVDVENLYVSSERVFDPKLRGVPVLVLSNGDHCAIARSAEAKAMGVKMGDPVFKIRGKIERHGFALRSSNYELYADMNRRFNGVLQAFTDTIEIYSIDESWFRLPVLANGRGDVATARAVSDRILRDTGLPTRIGLGPTRTLSKVANGLAKASEKVWGGFVDLNDVELRDRMFREWPVEEVWGVGRPLLVEDLPNRSVLELGMSGALAAALSSTNRPWQIILDEPTNHLDIESVELLEDALRRFDGALLVVSHDQSFLTRVGIDRFFEV